MQSTGNIGKELWNNPLMEGMHSVLRTALEAFNGRFLQLIRCYLVHSIDNFQMVNTVTSFVLGKEHFNKKTEVFVCYY